MRIELSTHLPASFVSGIRVIVSAMVVAGLASALAVPAQAQVAANAAVSLTDTGFQPASVTIAVGGSVTWTDSASGGPHSVVDPGGAFDSGALNPGQTFTHQFTSAGTYNYSSYFDCHDDTGVWRTSSGNFNCQALVNVVQAQPAPAPAATASAAPPAAAGPCQFILGFKTLHDLAAADVGDCVDNQYFLANGDADQHTTKGLLAWRKADNWTAFTNGYMTWINGPGGLVKRLNTQRFSWEANPEHLPLVS